MLKGFICEKTGENMAFDDCLECARTRLSRKLGCPFDEAVIAGMHLYQQNRSGISVTMLSGCHRGTFLGRHNDTYSYPSGQYWAFRGQIGHKIMEEVSLHEDEVKEKRFVKEWDGIEISGTPDLIIPNQKVLKDYKTSKSVPSYRSKTTGQVSAWENHRVQLNLYRWLVPYEIDTMEVVYFSMEETLICPVEIWPEEARKKSDMSVDKYMEENLLPLQMALDSDTMPPFKPHWTCDQYCGVSELCFRELKKELTAARLRVVKPTKGKGAKNGKDSGTKKRRANVAT
jgi:CRISPR/Cas system-associated exonuclease Cas4 (RecB family)